MPASTKKKKPFSVPVPLQLKVKSLVTTYAKTHTEELVILAVIIIIAIPYLLFLIQIKPVKESLRTEVKKIPKDIHITPPAQEHLSTVSATVRVPILLYHYVENIKDTKDKTRHSLNIAPATFDQQIKTLKDAGYTFMTAAELANVINGKRTLPLHPVLITIDDGHWDVYTDILPILEKYHAKATAYIITGFIGGSDFMTSDQLTKVIQNGLIEIGAHTVHHIALAGKLQPIVQYEVNQSKKTLEEQYHLHVYSFAYPNGSFDQQAANVVKDAGFTNAVSTIPGIIQSQSNKYFLYRIRPGYRTGPQLLQYLQQQTFSAW